jgi:broad specificity phosphatase PhoE
VRTLIFETHATSVDNEAGLASGHADVDLSPRGEREARELGERYAPGDLALVVTSDLRRAWRTAELAFAPHGASAHWGPDTTPRLLRDARLREVDYGTLTRRPAREVDALREAAIDAPFPGGERYADVVARVRACLVEVASQAEGPVLLIGHRATHYAVAHLLAGVPLLDQIRTPFVWRPGWRYDLQRLAPVARAH